MSTETKIQRYDKRHSLGISFMVPCDDGEWMRHSDHLAAVEEAREAALEEAAAFLEDQLWPGNELVELVRSLKRPAEKGEKA